MLNNDNNNNNNNNNNNTNNINNNIAMYCMSTLEIYISHSPRFHRHFLTARIYKMAAQTH